jgi:hypothetical protein
MNAAPPVVSSLQWWDDHGTKILGSVTAMLGGAIVGLPTLQPIMGHATYLLTQFFLGVAVSAMGGATVRRGFTNSASLP